MHPTPSGTSSGASSLAQPSPLTTTSTGLLGLPGVPQIVEDEDSYEDRPPLITVEDEQIDEFPFDPSIPDEMLFQQDAYDNERRPLVKRTVAPPAHTLLSRLLPSSSSSIIHSSPSIPSMPSHMHGREEAESESFAHRLVARFHRRRPVDGEGGGGGSGDGVEPGVLLSSRSPAAAKMRLVPLAEAQGRPDIANRPEGFELAEAKMRGAP